MARWSRPASASGARCSTTCCRASCRRSAASASTRRWPRSASRPTGGPRRSASRSGWRSPRRSAARVTPEARPPPGRSRPAREGQPGARGHRARGPTATTSCARCSCASALPDDLDGRRRRAGAGSTRSTVDGDPECPVEGNLVLRAAALCARRGGAGRCRGARLPPRQARSRSAAGLGGGSSDAAAALDLAAAALGRPTRPGRRASTSPLGSARTCRSSLGGPAPRSCPASASGSAAARAASARWRPARDARQRAWRPRRVRALRRGWPGAGGHPATRPRSTDSPRGCAAG